LHKNYEEVTALLAAWQEGDSSALEKMLPLVDDELHRIARHYLSRQHQDEALQTSALINEVHIILRRQRIDCRSLTQFFAIAAQTIRRILVNYSPEPFVGKTVAPDDFASIREERARELKVLEAALQKLSRLDPLQAQVVELRYFEGLDVEEIAVVLEVSPDTVSHELDHAKTFLRNELAQTPS
jgi:RNA polymerase sigma factor (TIGR02999 family)